LIAVVLASLALAGDVCADEAKAAEAEAELQALWEADQRDHEEGVDKLDKLDAKRAKEGAKYVKAGRVCTPKARYFAAALMARSRDADALMQSYELAKAAMMDGVEGAAWRTAVSYDLWQVSRGLEQRYASQMVSQGGRVCLYPVMADSTDAERVQYGLPTLVDAYRRVLDANGFTREAATEASVGGKQLFCELKPW